MFRPAPSVPGTKKIIDDIQTAFYNPILECILLDDSVTLENLRDKFQSAIGAVVNKILELSKHMTDAIRLPNGIVLTIENCPETYQQLFKQLILFKREQKKSILDQVMQNLYRHPNFQEMYPKLGKFIAEAKGWVEVQKPAHSYDLSGVTIQLIRDTFYNELTWQLFDGIANGYISHDDIESQEAFIYLALSALTILEAISLSKDCNGIVLLGNKLLDKSNCPTSEGFDQLFFPLLDNLNKIAKIEGLQRQLLIRLCLSKAEPIPDELLSHRTKDVTDCAAIVNRIASVISQRDYFKVKITEVIKSYLEDCKSVSRHKP